MALSFRARFDMEEVYHNSFLKHAWGSEEIPYWFPLQTNEEFNITFQSDDQGFKVQNILLLRHAVDTEAQQKTSHWEHQNFPINISFESLAEFKYLWIALTNQNCIN